MIDGKKIVVVMPAYNASKTLSTTYAEIPFWIVDDVVLVDAGYCNLALWLSGIDRR